MNDFSQLSVLFYLYFGFSQFFFILCLSSLIERCAHPLHMFRNQIFINMCQLTNNFKMTQIMVPFKNVRESKVHLLPKFILFPIWFSHK